MKNNEIVEGLLEVLDCLEDCMGKLRDALRGKKVVVESKCSTKIKERSNGKKKSKPIDVDAIDKKTKAIVKELKKYGFKIEKNAKTTWHILDKNGEKVGVVKPKIGCVERLVNDNDGISYKRVKVKSFKKGR